MKAEVLYLSRADVERVALPTGEVVDAVSKALAEKGAGRAQMPPKPGIHPVPHSFIHAMPAYLPKLEAAGVKWLGGFADNKSKGLPYISGLIVLNDPESGLPLAIMDATWVTAVRTAGATAVAVRHLAREGAQTLAILGCGVQARSHTRVLPGERPALRTILAYDHHEENARNFQEELGGKDGIEIRIARSAEEAVRGADVVVTAGAILEKPEPVIALEWLAEGAFLCALDHDSYVRADACVGADKFACDDTPQFLHYRNQGHFQGVPDPYADLGEILDGRKPGREAESERIVCQTLGLAIEDIAVARRVYDRAREKGVGTVLPL